jgi:hypothetical protein
MMSEFNRVHHHNISEFPKNFDVKSVNEDLNVCTEMYWKGEEDLETNKILGDHTAVCDDCFSKLKKGVNND